MEIMQEYYYRDIGPYLNPKKEGIGFIHVMNLQFCWDYNN